MSRAQRVRHHGRHLPRRPERGRGARRRRCRWSIAGYNGPAQTVIAGTGRGRRRGCDGAPMPALTRDPAVRVARLPLAAGRSRRPTRSAQRLAGETFGPVEPPGRLDRHRRAPGRRHRPAGAAAPADHRARCGSPRRSAPPPTDVDLFVEVGPGRVLSGLAADGDRTCRRSRWTPTTSRWPGCSAWSARRTSSARSRRGRGAVRRPADAAAARSAPSSRSSPARARRRPPLSPDCGPAVAAAAPSPRADPRSGRPAGTDGRRSTLLRRLAAERAELPLDLVRADSHLLDDLHLSSITVGQIVNQAARELGVARRPGADQLRHRDGRRAGRRAGRSSRRAPAAATARPRRRRTVGGRRRGLGPAVVDRPRRAPRAGPGRPPSEPGAWQVYADRTPARRAAAARAGGRRPSATACWSACPSSAPRSKLELALHGRPAGDRRGPAAPGSSWSSTDRGAAGLAKTLHLEAPTRCRHHHRAHPRCDAGGGRPGGRRSRRHHRFTRGHLRRTTAAAGCRRCAPCRCGRPGRPPPSTAPTCCWSPAAARASPPSARSRWPPTAGPGWRCSAAPTRPQDVELATNLQRMADAGVTVRYARADVSDDDAGPRGGRRAAGELGPVTAVLHGAGRNEPAGLTSLDTDAFRQDVRAEDRRPASRARRRSTRPTCSCSSRSAASSAGPGCAARRTTRPPTSGWPT